MQNDGPQVQNDCDTQFGTGIPTPKSPPSKNPDHESKVSMVLTAFGRLMWQLLPRKTHKAA
jgi:hypothetical protein